MLTIYLHSITSSGIEANGAEAAGTLREVGPHPYFMDYEARDVSDRYDPTQQKRVTETQSIVTVDFHNALAPVLLEMNQRPVRDSVGSMPRVRGHKSVPPLERALEHLRRNHSHREDGIRVGALLIAWATQHPHSAWTVTTDSAEEAEILASRTLDQHIAASNYRIQAHRARRVQDVKTGAFREVEGAADDAQGEPEHDPDQCPLAGATTHTGERIMCPSCNKVTDNDLQPETRTPGHGGGGGSRRKKKKASAGGTPTPPPEPDHDDRRGTGPIVSGRVSEEVHELYAKRGAKLGASAGEALEVVGRAALLGISFAEMRERLGLDKSKGVA